MIPNSFHRLRDAASAFLWLFFPADANLPSTPRRRRKETVTDGGFGVRMAKLNKTRSKTRKILARNKLRNDAHLPLLPIADELAKMESHEQKMAFEAFFTRAYSQFKDFIPEANGFFAKLGRKAMIKDIALQEYHKRRAN